MKKRLQKFLWQWLHCQEEVDRRVNEMTTYLADQHTQKVKAEREQLGRLIRPLLRYTAEYNAPTGRLTYTTMMDERLLFDSLNDRRAFFKYLAEEIAYNLTTIKPVRCF